MDLDIDEYTGIAAHKLLVQIVNALTESHKAREIVYQHLLPRNEAIAAAVAAEREECAKIADVLANPDTLRLPPDGRIAAEIIAISIRERGE